jgi:hypothetical protein
MYRSAVILIVTVVLAAAMWLVFAQLLTVVDLLAVIDDRAGPVEVLHGETASVARLGDLVRAGDRIRTGRAAHVGVHWADGSRIEVGPESELVVQRCRINKLRKTRSTHFRLNLGEIWLRLRGTINRGSKFEVETPTIVAAVRGTIFSVKVLHDGTTHLQVYEGQVDILGDHATQAIEAGAVGQCATVGKTGFATKSMSAAEAQRWRAKGNIIGPLLAVDEPACDSTTSVALVPVSGRTEQLATVTVNGERVRVKRLRETFRTRARLIEGPNLITVVATIARMRTTVTRRVTYVNPTHVIALTSRPSRDPHDAAGVMDVEAVLRDARGELVPDGTPVELLADRGMIPRHHRTERGAVSAKWQPGGAGVPTHRGPPTRVTARSGAATATAVISSAPHPPSAIGG